MTVPTNLTKRLVDALEPREKPYEQRDTEVRGFLVRMEPGGSKTFFLDYRLKGNRNRYRIGLFGNLSVDSAREIRKSHCRRCGQGD